MKKILFLLFSFFLGISFVSANNISLIDMDIILDEFGTATVTETWKANVTQGTEGWHPYYNLGKTELEVISASMDDKPFTIEKYWNEGASMKEKAYKAGIYNASSNEKDIVFGITEYGTHTYKIVYKMTNFVSNITDADIIYWQLFPYDFSAEPDNVTIKISGPYEYPDTLDIWGYGMYGAPCYVKDGAIYMTSDGPIKSTEYLTLLAKFPKATFKTGSLYNHDFKYYQDMANEGAEIYKQDKDSDFWEWFEVILVLGINFLFVGIPILIAILFGNEKRYGYKDNKLITKKNTNFFREIPCNKDIYYANALVNINRFGYKPASIMGAIILKWVKENKIVFKNVESGLFNKETSVIDLTKDSKFDLPIEEELFDLMRAASGDGLLEPKELEKWCKKHYNKYLNLFDKICNNEINRLKTEGHIYKRANKAECKFKNVMDDTIYKDSQELYGLKLFLEEFSQMNIKEVLEVHLWDEYLMFAYLFNIADKVAKQLKDLYPEVVKNLEQQGLDIGTIMYINNLSTRSVHAASAAKAAAESYSSGGGGFSSGGGGGGSFGGGGGGGGFR